MDLSETQDQSGCTIVRDRDENIAGYQYFICDKVFSYVIHRPNVAKDVGASNYSGRHEVNGTICVALYDSTLDPSGFFTHKSCVLN